MFYEKKMRPIGISFVIVSMLLSIWASTSMLHARVGPSAFDVSGAITFDDCKEPCSDSGVMYVIECTDYNGVNCETDSCTINGLRLLVCTECEKASPGADDCEYHIDPTDWQRWILKRWMPCDSNDETHVTYDDCVRSGVYGGWSTPCLSQECYGELYDDRALSMGRARCD